VDSPTRYGTDTGAGGEVRGNYATWNPLRVFNAPTINNGNLNATHSSANYAKTVGTIAIDVESTTGYYFECTLNGSSTDNTAIGIFNGSTFTNAQGDTGFRGLGSRGAGGGNTWWKMTDTSYTTDTTVAHGSAQVIGVAVKNGKIYVSINNTWVLSGNPSTESNPLFSGLSGNYFPYICIYQNNGADANFGQRPFSYTAPSGFKALCTTNLL
jgi:hypothetical protein